MPKMTRMISLMPHVYAGRAITPGEEFDVEDQHVSVWIILGRAKLKPPPEEPSYGTRMMTARGAKRTRTLQ